MLEKMDEFFDRRIEAYEAHMLNEIEDAREFYPYTASLLPRHRGAEVLDLGCGTGLELDFYYKINPHAKVTGFDLSEKMLQQLWKKFPDGWLSTIQGSFIDFSFWGPNDAIVSVEALHHYTKEEKVSLYRHAHRSLKADGYLILTDYFAASEEEEESFRLEFARLKEEQGIEQGLYHFDIPLTTAHEIEALLEAGFVQPRVLRCWGATCTIKAMKQNL